MHARAAVLLAALLAFSWQSFVADTHQHLRPDTIRTVAAAKLHGPAPSRDPSDSPANCPICRELAHVAFYLPPAPITLDIPAPAPVALVAAVLVYQALRQPSHRWRSRAPPLPL